MIHQNNDSDVMYSKTLQKASVRSFEVIRGQKIINKPI